MYGLLIAAVIPAAVITVMLAVFLLRQAGHQHAENRRFERSRRRP